MATRYRWDKQKLQLISSVSCGHCSVWPSICCFCLSRRYFVAIVLSDLRFVASVYFVCILWPLYCLTFDLQLLFNSSGSYKSKVRQYKSHKILTRSTETSHQRSNNTMTTRYRRDEQKLQIEGQTIQWLQNTDEIRFVDSVYLVGILWALYFLTLDL
jgi:hypothetical protein